MTIATIIIIIGLIFYMAYGEVGNENQEQD